MRATNKISLNTAGRNYLTTLSRNTQKVHVDITLFEPVFQYIREAYAMWATNEVNLSQTGHSRLAIRAPVAFFISAPLRLVDADRKALRTKTSRYLWSANQVIGRLEPISLDGEVDEGKPTCDHGGDAVVFEKENGDSYCRHTLNPHEFPN